MPRAIIFDVNETLLDLRALDPHFERVFGDADVRREWFQQFVQNFLVTIVLGKYVEFGAIGRGALDMVAERLGRRLTDGDRRQILGTIRELPPYPEVRESLEHLKAAGFRLGTLTNSTKQVAEAQMRNAGLVDLFEHVLSADEVKRLKPGAEPYRMAAERFGVSISELRLVAAHAWDVAGALNAGCKAAFVARPGIVLDPIHEPPDIVGRDLREIAAKIMTMETRA
ncbi:MAG: haloacid dehalogenase type II [Armatimonadota bacterium]